MNIYGWNNAKTEKPINRIEDVLVTVDDHGSRWVIPDARYHGGKWEKKVVDDHYEFGKNPWDEIWVDTVWEEIMFDVVAWMYLPDPYELPTEPERAEE